MMRARTGLDGWRAVASVIIDASVVVDAVSDPGERGDLARDALESATQTELLEAPGHFAFEVLSALNAVARRPGHPLAQTQISVALAEAEEYRVHIRPTPWVDVRRAQHLARTSLRFADAVYVAAAERQGVDLLTSDPAIAKSGARVGCRIVTIG